MTSLTGDYFRPGERGRMLGDILAGELVGVAIGYMLLGNADVTGLDHALLVLLAALAVAGLILLTYARRTYARDVATTIASQATMHASTDSPAAGGTKPSRSTVPRAYRRDRRRAR